MSETKRVYTKTQWDKLWQKIYRIVDHDALCAVYDSKRFNEGCTCMNRRNTRKLFRLLENEGFFSNVEVIEDDTRAK